MEIFSVGLYEVVLRLYTLEKRIIYFLLLLVYMVCILFICPGVGVKHAPGNGKVCKPDI